MEAIGGGCFYVFGDDLSSWGYTVWGWFFHFLVLCSGTLIGADLICKFWPKRRWIWTGWAISCSILFALYCWLSPGPRRELPHFEFILNTADYPRANVKLTNDLINVKEFNKPAKASGILFVPVKLAQSNVVFEIGVMNVSRIVPEFGEVCITIPSEWNGDLKSGWFPCDTPDTWVINETNPLKSWVCKLPQVILPDDVCTLPGISIRPQLLPARDGFLVIAAKTKNSPIVGVCIKVYFYPPTHGMELSRPLLLSPQFDEAGHAWTQIPDKEFQVSK